MDRFHFLICYVKSSNQSRLSNERKNKWTHPSGSAPLGPFAPYLLFGSRWECPFIFFTRYSRRFYITYQKMKQIGPYPRKLWPFESMPGQPIYGLFLALLVRKKIHENSNVICKGFFFAFQK